MCTSVLGVYSHLKIDTFPPPTVAQFIVILFVMLVAVAFVAVVAVVVPVPAVIFAGEGGPLR